MKTLIAIVLAFVAGNAWTAPYIEGTPLAGKVLESIDAGTYTYLRLETAPDADQDAPLPRRQAAQRELNRRHREQATARRRTSTAHAWFHPNAAS